MATSDYTFVTSLLNAEFAPRNQLVICEKGVQQALVDASGRGVTAYRLYRYEMTERDYMEILNRRNHPPRHLRAFADYILVAEYKGLVHIFLIELKSGDPGHAPKQLEASADFVDYLLARAEHIKQGSGFDRFSPKHVRVRKVLLRPGNMRPRLRPSGCAPTGRKNHKIGDRYQGREPFDIRRRGDIFEYFTFTLSVSHLCRHT